LVTEANSGQGQTEAHSVRDQSTQGQAEAHAIWAQSISISELKWRKIFELLDVLCCAMFDFGLVCGVLRRKEPEIVGWASN
jgi:hypothetical protein